jgi:hypothetical protein
MRPDLGKRLEDLASRGAVEHINGGGPRPRMEVIQRHRDVLRECLGVEKDSDE